MDPCTDPQARLEISKVRAAERYPNLWSKIISEWHMPGDDRAWLMYAANYLFRSENVLWAIDPLRLCQRIPDAPVMDIRHDLAPLSFVLLTHRHADHLDLGLVSALKDSPTLWVVPEYLLEIVQSAGISRERIVIPRALEPLHIHGITIVPFEGLHWEDDPAYPDGRRGVPATGYLLEFNGKRWLFPGDTRTYDANLLPYIGRVDGSFAHLWLGRGCAQLETPPLLEAFCRFCLALEPKQIVLAHMEEYGRSPDDFWGAEHAQKVMQCLKELDPNIQALPVYMGNQIGL
jgi:L-ascorbate metabolism protein UlaG (beta-lactamase superfamily)